MASNAFLPRVILQASPTEEERKHHSCRMVYSKRNFQEKNLTASAEGKKKKTSPLTFGCKTCFHTAAIQCTAPCYMLRIRRQCVVAVEMAQQRQEFSSKRVAKAGQPAVTVDRFSSSWPYLSAAIPLLNTEPASCSCPQFSCWFWPYVMMRGIWENHSELSLNLGSFSWIQV